MIFECRPVYDASRYQEFLFTAIFSLIGDYSWGYMLFWSPFLLAEKYVDPKPLIFRNNSGIPGYLPHGYSLWPVFFQSQAGRLVNRVNGLRPDFIVLLGGDYVPGARDYIKPCFC